MHIQIEGRIGTEDFDRVVAATMGMLSAEGVSTITNITLNFLAWGADGERRQAVDGDGFVATMSIQGEAIAAVPYVVELAVPETISFRDRPQDMDFSMFDLGARRDD
ncbi:hypothetical protein VH570_26425 [Sphingobium sp. HT1-2]|uniref:hypothetical protein n=1 Tax=Sphingobium sp. HT1-2 TaxID=3111640 RepID=UPI003C0DFB5A